MTVITREPRYQRGLARGPSPLLCCDCKRAVLTCANARAFPLPRLLFSSSCNVTPSWPPVEPRTWLAREHRRSYAHGSHMVNVWQSATPQRANRAIVECNNPAHHLACARLRLEGEEKAATRMVHERVVCTRSDRPKMVRPASSVPSFAKKPL